MPTSAKSGPTTGARRRSAGPPLALAVQYAVDDPALPPRRAVRRWVAAAAERPAALTVRFVGEDEGRALNRAYRGRDYATNVLTFVYSDDAPPAVAASRTRAAPPSAAAAAAAGHRRGASPERHLEGSVARTAAAALSGDIVVCAPVVAREAAEQAKSPLAHCAHLVIHGMLHLQGYDHEADDEAARMEMRESQILGTLGFPDPYSG